MRPEIETLFSEETIQERINALAAEIAPRLQADCIVVSLMNGAFIFAADLVRALSRLQIPLCLDFMVLSSYGSKTQSSGQIITRLECTQDLSQRQVLLVDDILDTGSTLAFAKQLLLNKGAGELLTCVLLDKPSRRTTEVSVDFVGFQIPNLFVVGYGIDYNQMFRELPFLGHLRAS
ncbi:MAG: hypoxanthine phosphoribosyltransferase [Magnetococcales bacterium]|nr:hypoxanthine phosphoribosyltransferase [Magnetococcales bacterium]MBF0439498.1 hypoxanthine phosphoribosyltransferase [Magnetococcales bacterium]